MLNLLATAVLTVAILGTPSGGSGIAINSTVASRAERIELFIVKINPKARLYAELFAKSIIVESRRYGLDPYLMTAIIWGESWFQVRAPGASGERGGWQIMRGLSTLRPAWDRLRYVTQGLDGYPDADWDQMSRSDQDRALRDPVLSTFLAAWLMAWHKARCDYPTTARCYGRYNSGNANVRWGYVKALARRAAHVRRAVAADIH